jgi:hypothetical protein
MATVNYARKSKQPDTQYFQFKDVREAKAGLNSGATYDADTGASPVARWLAFAFDYDDFVSNPDATGYVVRCQLPMYTIVMEALVRVDTAWTADGKDDIDIGDGNAAAGWADGIDFTSTGIQADRDAVYNDYDADPADGSAGYQFYDTGDTIDVLWKNAVAPAAGEAILFLKTLSYHEALSAEW